MYMYIRGMHFHKRLEKDVGSLGTVVIPGSEILMSLLGIELMPELLRHLSNPYFYIYSCKIFQNISCATKRCFGYNYRYIFVDYFLKVDQ